MSAFFAYKNKWGRVVTQIHDQAEVIEAIKSPSIVGIIRFIEAENFEQADSFARKAFSGGEFETTFGGRQ